MQASSVRVETAKRAAHGSIVIMEGAPNDGTSADPTMTLIERQMQAIRKGPLAPHDDNQPPPRGENRSNDQEADSCQVTCRRGGKVERTPPRSRHRAESAGSSAPPSQHKTAKTTRSSKQLEKPDQSSKQPERPYRDPDDKTARLEKELREMKKQMGDMKNSLKVKAARNLDNLVHQADSPFIPSIVDFPLPSRFKLQAVPEEVMCRPFPLGLRGSARVWFNKLESESISSFVQLSRAFIDHFIGSQRRGRPPTHLLNVKQMEGESLKAFVHRFNEEAMKIDRPKEDITVTAFMAGLRKGDFLYDLCKDPLETMSELMYEATKHMNAEDALEAMDDPLAKRQRKRTTAPLVKFSSFTPLNTPIDKLLLQIQDDPSLRWPGKIRSDPNSRPKNLYCRSMSAVQQIPVQQSLQRKGNKLNTTGRGPLEKSEPSLEDRRLEEPYELQGKHMHDSEEDARGTHQPHDDALVITINILDKDKLRPMDAPLVGFTGDKVCPIGIVTLPITVGTHPMTVSKTVDFLVVNCPSAYNAIIGRPILNRLRVVTSTYHLLLKLPTEHGIGEVKGDQVAARECYLASLGSEGQNQTMTIEDKTKAEGLRTRKEQRHHGRGGQTPSGKLHQGSILPRLACQRSHGYNQIVMDESDQEKTSFITSRGLFCYKVMPFGLKNAGATYQRLMNRMFHDQIGRNVEVYVDDMLVKYKEEDGHLDDLKETFETLRKYQMKLNPSKCAFGVYSDKFLGFMVSQRGIEANPDKIKAILEMQPPKTTKEVQRLTGRLAALNRFMSRSTDKCLPFFKTLKKAFEWTDECQQAFEELKRYLTKPPLLSPSKQGEELYLYLAVSPTAVSSALIREEERRQLLVYYTSRALRGAEERYPSMEKLAFALVTAARKLRPYFQAHTIVLLTNHPLRKAMNKPDAAGRLIQWSSTRDSGGVGIVLKLPEGDTIKQAVRLQYPTTNNEAEYEALLARLKMAKILGATELDVLSDSQLVVGQVNGDYEAKEGRMQQYLHLVRHQIGQFREVRLSRIPREQNTGADQLAKSASSSTANDKIKIVQQSSLQAIEMNPGVLYKRGFSLPYLRCLAPDEAKYVMREIHEGICGNHLGARALQKKIVRAGYYWPSMQADANRFVQHCDKCQRFANLLHSPPEVLVPMTAPWPFAQWGLDIIGLFPIGRRQLKFLVVAIDYFTK
uniref:RNase H type-1 domain-containing protein n=1 Tax=Fagus sylvatica TaxID=28930 RepID=A0A2N9F6A6_FAGSY